MATRDEHIHGRHWHRKRGESAIISIPMSLWEHVTPQTIVRSLRGAFPNPDPALDPSHTSSQILSRDWSRTHIKFIQNRTETRCNNSHVVHFC